MATPKDVKKGTVLVVGIPPESDTSDKKKWGPLSTLQLFYLIYLIHFYEST